MPCYKPLRGFFTGFNPETGKPQYTIKPWHDKETGEKYYPHVEDFDFIPIPCGKCIGCRLDKARDWTARLMAEQEYHPENECWFLTLTYSDEALKSPDVKRLVPEIDEFHQVKLVSTLVPEDMTLFWKRLRQKIKRDLHYDGKLSYFMAAEYGSRTRRAHYHAIVYGLPIPPEKLEFYKRNELGQPLYKCRWLDDIWSLGYVTVGTVTPWSCGYTARYCVKKLKDYGYDYQNRCPEYVRMSRRPGLGLQWIFDFVNDPGVDPDAMIFSTSKGHQKYKLPRYFLRKLEGCDLDLLEEVKAHRQEVGRLQTENILKSGKWFLDELHDRAIIKEQQINSKLPRSGV